MHHLDAAAMLQRLTEATPVNSRERYGYQVEQFGQYCARMGLYHGDLFSTPWMLNRYNMSYCDTLARMQCGEGITLSPIEVWSLRNGA